MTFFVAGFTLAIVFGMPPWLIALLGVGMLVSIVWYNLNARWHNHRTVSDKGVKDDLRHASRKYLTKHEKLQNFWDKFRRRPPRHQPRSEVEHLYNRNTGHD